MLVLHPFADKEPWLGLQEGPLPLDLVPASLGMWFFLPTDQLPQAEKYPGGREAQGMDPTV